MGTIDFSNILMQSMYIMLWLSMPPIIAATTIGVLVSIFQALTQIQEQTLSFAIKLIVIGICLFFLSGWMGMEIYRFTIFIYELIPTVMRAWPMIDDEKDFILFLVTWVLVMPRIYIPLMLLPIISGSTVAQSTRLAIALTFTYLVVPRVLGDTIFHLMPLDIVLLLIKECFVGFALGYLLCIPFWMFEAVGFFIDNQRGAGVGSLVNTMTGNETAAMGVYFMQMFTVVFFSSYGFNFYLDLLYTSYISWDVISWFPVFSIRALDIFLRSFSDCMANMALYSSPIILAMFMVELGLALVSRSVPQLQVFILAMSLKSAIAFFLLIPYIPQIMTLMSKNITQVYPLFTYLRALWGGVASGW